MYCTYTKSAKGFKGLTTRKKSHLLSKAETKQFDRHTNVLESRPIVFSSVTFFFKAPFPPLSACCRHYLECNRSSVELGLALDDFVDLRRAVGAYSSRQEGSERYGSRVRCDVDHHVMHTPKIINPQQKTRSV